VDIIQIPQTVYKFRFTLHTGYPHRILLELVNSPGVRLSDDAIRQEFLRCPGESVLVSVSKNIVMPYAFNVHPPKRFVKRVT
jgi:hypothetical protein